MREFNPYAWYKSLKVPSNELRVERFFQNPELLGIDSLWCFRSL